MTKKLILAALVVIIGCLAVYQLNKPVPTPINWQMLGIGFKKTWHEEYKADVSMPLFTDTLQKLNGHWVALSGYVIPMEYGSKKFALSKNPNSSCFFCGGAGVETMVIVICKNKPIDYPNDAFIKVVGRLNLVNSFNDFIYVLTDAY
jgi:hypothetical protein